MMDAYQHASRCLGFSQAESRENFGLLGEARIRQATKMVLICHLASIARASMLVLTLVESDRHVARARAIYRAAHTVAQATKVVFCD